jgi:hypothetical protein
MFSYRDSLIFRGKYPIPCVGSLKWNEVDPVLKWWSTTPVGEWICRTTYESAALSPGTPGFSGPYIRSGPLPEIELWPLGRPTLSSRYVDYVIGVPFSRQPYGTKVTWLQCNLWFDDFGSDRVLRIDAGNCLTREEFRYSKAFGCLDDVRHHLVTMVTHSQRWRCHVSVDVFTVATMKNVVFWDIKLCSYLVRSTLRLR